MRRTGRWLCGFLLIACGARPSLAQPGSVTAPPGGSGVPTAMLPAPMREIGFDQRLGASIPLDLQFRDETGKAVRLGQYFTSKPVILALVYFDCPMLCSEVLNGLAGSLKALSFDAGTDFTVLAVSFDPKDTWAKAEERRQASLERYGRDGAERGWHFLTGDAASIEALTEAVGFRFVADPVSGQFAHAAGLTVLTPRGVIARYLFGIEYGPRDLRLALVEASTNRIGTPIDQVLLYCYMYDPATGKYGLIAMRLIRIGGVATVAAMALFIIVMRRRERHP